MLHLRRALPLVVLLAACAPPQIASDPLKPVTNGEAFEGVSCSAVRPQTEPDLMAWDPGSRLNLKRLRGEGVVAVRYEAEGCNVKLELLSNCLATGSYKYTPYSANEHKVAHNANELFAQLPIGAASLTGKVKGDKALRTDYMLVGQYALPAASSFKRGDLRGADCSRATHVVSAVYAGGFALVSGEERALDAAATVFGAGAGASQLASAERLADEGNPQACKEAQETAKASDKCDVPLRIGLLKLDGPVAACPDGATWDGAKCVQKQVSIECPAGSSLQDGKCVARVSTSCSAGMHFVAGMGCVPDVVGPPPAAQPAAQVPPPAVSGGACPAGMVSLAGGSFTMGDRQDQVTVSTFCLDATEVTVDAFGACVRAGQCSADNVGTQFWDNQDHGEGACNWGVAGRGNHPINCVDWGQAATYCNAQGKRLPTEEQWEWAARGGSRGFTYPWGNAEPDFQACWSGVSERSGTCPVGSLPQGDAPGGIHDLAGNVWEWTSSNYDASARVDRGGGWYNSDPSDLRAADRSRVHAVGSEQRSRVSLRPVNVAMAHMLLDDSTALP
jgi:formylglycine-generating enzyme required for sulfatase activity